MFQLAIVILYFAAVIGIGVLTRRKRWSLDEFFVSGRRVSTLLVTGSLLATIIGGSATIGMTGLGFTRGLTGSWWMLAGCAGLLVLGFFLARKVREYGLYTLPELAGKQYDGRIALASSILISVAWLGVIAGQIIAAGKIASAIGIGSPVLWMVLFTVVFTGYVMLGGQNAVIRTDILQAGIIFAGILAGLGITLWHVGGISGLVQALPADRFDFPLSSRFGLPELASYLLLIGSTYVAGPDIYSRLFSARDARTARRAVFWTAALLVPVALAVTLIGMGASVLFPDIPAENSFPSLINILFPPWLGGLMLAALLAAVMSSADSTIMSAGTIVAVDILGRFNPGRDKNRILKYSRFSILIIGLLSLGLALMLQGIINALMFAYTIYTCGVIIPVLAGFYRKKLKITSNAALAAVIGGGLTGLISKIWAIKYLDLGAILVSLVLLLSVSLLENRLMGRRREEGEILNSKP